MACKPSAAVNAQPQRPQWFSAQVVTRAMEAAFPPPAFRPIISVTRVSMTGDLQMAQAWVSVLGSDDQAQDIAVQTLQGLTRYKGREEGGLFVMHPVSLHQHTTPLSSALRHAPHCNAAVCDVSWQQRCGCDWPPAWPFSRTLRWTMNARQRRWRNR